MSRDTHESLQLRALQAIQGIEKNLAAMGKFPIQGKTYTPASLAAYFKGYSDRLDALRAAHDLLHKLVEEEAVARVEFVDTLRGLDAMASNLYGPDPVKLGEFGYAPRRVGTQDVATKLAAIAKRKATRLARHTMGPKQKLAITGAPPPPPAPAVPPPPSPAAAIDAPIAAIASSTPHDKEQEDHARPEGMPLRSLGGGRGGLLEPAEGARVAREPPSGRGQAVPRDP